MAEIVTIRSVKQFFNEYIAEPTQKNGTDWLRRHQSEIKAQLIDAFRKEIFGQVVFRIGPQAKSLSPNDLVNLDIVQNIMQQSFRKWRRLCILCGEMGVPLIGIEDLEKALEEDDSDVEENAETTNSAKEM